MTDVIILGFMTVVIEPVRPADRAALEQLFADCSAETVQHRFSARLRVFPAEYLESLLADPPEVHDAVVARDVATAKVVGLGSLARPAEANEEEGAEIGLLVADAWQRQGLGRAMAGTLLARARERSVTRLRATVAHGRSALLGALTRRLEPVSRLRSREGLTGIYRLSGPG
jgi:GNAT superfamily N-acetyltransferase